MFEMTCIDNNGNPITHLTQWDVNQILSIDLDSINISSLINNNAPKVHFCNKKSEEAYVVESTIENNQLSAHIPNKLLTMPYTIMAYLYLEENDSGQTIYKIVIPVDKRPRPADYIYVDDSSSVISIQDVIDALDSKPSVFVGNPAYATGAKEKDFCVDGNRMYYCYAVSSGTPQWRQLVYDIDAEMSSSSINPVRNNVIKLYVDTLRDGITSGSITAKYATNATNAVNAASALKANADSLGHDIPTTYATKLEVSKKINFFTYNYSPMPTTNATTYFEGLKQGDIVFQNARGVPATWYKCNTLDNGNATWIEELFVPKPSVSDIEKALVVNQYGVPEWQNVLMQSQFVQTKIPANGDVNSSDYRAVGSYGCSTTTARTLSNIPSGLDTGFILHTYAPMDDKTEAFKTNGNWLYRYQELTAFNGMKKWVRYVQSNGNGEWTYGEWKTVYDLSQTMPKYELIKEEIITSAEPSSTGILWEDLNSEYDDVLITSNNVLGSANGNNYVVAIRTTGNTTISGNVYATINNIMSDTTPKNTYQKIERLNESLYDYRLGGAIQSNNIIPFPSNSSYSDKICRVSVTTGNNNTFTQGTFRIYGRKRF